MEDPEPFSTLQETNENNNVDFKNVLNGSVLSSLSKTLDLALLENSMSVKLDEKSANSVSCCDAATVSAPPANACTSDDTGAVAMTPLTTGTEECSRGPQTSLRQEDTIPEVYVPSSICDTSVPSSNCDNSQTSLIPTVNSLPEVNASEARDTPNEATHMNGTQNEYRNVPSNTASEISDDSNSEELLPDIADTERISASTRSSTYLSEKLLPDVADTNRVSASPISSSEKLLSDNAEAKQTSASSPSSSKKLLLDNAETKQTSTSSSKKLLLDNAETKQTSTSLTSCSEKLLPDIADTKQISASSTLSSEKLLAEIADTKRTSGSLMCSSDELLPDTAELERTSPSPSCSSEKLLPDIADTKQTSASKSSSTSSSKKLLAGLANNKRTSSAVGSPNGLSAETSSSSVSQPFTSSSGSTSSVFPRSLSSSSGPNSFSFPAETDDLESSGDSSDYEDAFDWDLSGNIEYYDFKDREKVKLKQSVPREHDSSGGTSRLDFSAEMSLMETSSPFKRKRTHDDDERLDQNFGSLSRTGLRSGKRFKSSDVSKFLHVPDTSTSSSQPNVSLNSSTVNGGSNSFDRIFSSSTSSSKPSSISVPKAPSTGVFKAPSLTTRAFKPRGGSVTSRLSNRTPSNSRISIIPKPSALTSLGNTVSSSSVRSCNTGSLPSKGNINTVSSPSIKGGNIVSQPPTGTGNPTSSSSARSSSSTGSTTSSSSHRSCSTASSSSLSSGSSSRGPDPVSAHPNRARLRKVLLEVRAQHRRTRLLKTEKFAASRKKLLGDILKQLHSLQAHCVEGRM